MSQLQVIHSSIQALQPKFNEVLSDKQIGFEREAGFAMQLMQSNDYLAKVAFGNQASMQAAIINVAAIGISLNPASKQAYLVPRDGKVCLDISYMGMLHLAQQTGAIQWGQARIVRANDEFELLGIDEAPRHKFSPFAKDEDRGEIVGAYVVVKTDGGDYLTHAMPIAEIYAIRNASQSWKSGRSSPWKSHEGEMIKKTVVKQASKYWPHRDRLQQAVYHVDTEGGEGMDDGKKEQDVTPCSADDVKTIQDLLAQVGRTWEQLAAVYTGGMFAGKQIDDMTKPHAENVINILRRKVSDNANANN